VVAMGGTIEIDSAPNTGTTVSVTVPGYSEASVR
jgi:signal transduction histidine kinase